MIKHIDPKKLSKKLVYKRWFPGKTGDQICSMIDDIYADVEPSRVIIHAGTMNLPSRRVHSCVFNTEYLALKIRGKFQNAKIAISILTHRQEDTDASAKLLEVNIKLKEMTTRNGLTLWTIHTFRTCLYGKKLLLNSKESAYQPPFSLNFLGPPETKQNISSRVFKILYIIKDS